MLWWPKNSVLSFARFRSGGLGDDFCSQIGTKSGAKPLRILLSDSKVSGGCRGAIKKTRFFRNFWHKVLDFFGSGSHSIEIWGRGELAVPADYAVFVR